MSKTTKDSIGAFGLTAQSSEKMKKWGLHIGTAMTVSTTSTLRGGS